MRCEQDFFQGVPTADIYCISNTAHDWLTTEYATHQIDVVNWLLDTHPDSVCGYGGVDWYTEDGRDTDDNIQIIFNYNAVSSDGVTQYDQY